MVGKEVTIKTKSYKDYDGMNGVILRKLPDNDTYDYEVIFANGTTDYFNNEELKLNR